MNVPLRVLSNLNDMNAQKGKNIWSFYLQMGDEVGCDTSFGLNPCATSLAVGFDFAIFPFKYDIKVIQNRYLRIWRHWIVQPFYSEVNRTLDRRSWIDSVSSHLASDHESSVVFFSIEMITVWHESATKDHCKQQLHACFYSYRI